MFTYEYSLVFNSNEKIGKEVPKYYKNVLSIHLKKKKVI